MSPPLAGKPPFATDQPDSLFADQPKPIPRPKKQNVENGARDSAYTAFDTYFASGEGDSRTSGIGRGLMNAYDSSDDDSGDDKDPRKPAPVTSDKHRALYAAATAPPPSYEASPREKTLIPASVPIPRTPQVIPRAQGSPVSQHVETSSAHPQTPPRALLAAGGRPAALTPRQHHPHPHRGAQELTIQPPSPGFMHVPGSPHSPLSPNARTPQPLPPPQTPIMPVFARPRKDTVASNVTFDEKTAILRGNSEETLLTRGAGGKGDDFWRRFSMVAKEEAKGGSKKSAWLKKTENGSTRLSTWVWIVGIILLLCIGGGIGVGWYFTHNKPAAQPVAIGGSANEGFTSASSGSAQATNSASVKPTRVTAAPVPTNTSNSHRREVPAAHRRAQTSRQAH